MLVYLLVVRRFTPVTAVMYAIVTVVLVSLFHKESRLSPRRLLAWLEGTGRTMIEIGTVAALAGIIICL
jgi:TRAP-type uncharacterized transport system fused permease subunit